MPRSQKIANLGAVLVPFIAFVSAVSFGWNSWVDAGDLAVFGVLYLLTGFGVTMGYHRLLTHRAFQTHKWVQYTLAVLGTMSVQGPVISWVADHRKHHAHTDQEGDPHSPHVGHGSGISGALKGLFFAHVGWLMSEQGRAQRSRYAKDLLEDSGMRWISRHFLAIIITGLVIPTVLGFALHGFTLGGALRGYVWGGLVRVFLLHHVTWSINSVCHFVGTRRFATDDESRNVFWLALPSLGEAWHHNHHAFPRSATHGLKRFELDPTGWLVHGMKRTGLAWDVVEITPERQHQKEQEAREAARAPVAA
jgi:stearoyl-CoA desaturase (delta-9 desaturase)